MQNTNTDRPCDHSRARFTLSPQYVVAGMLGLILLSLAVITGCRSADESSSVDYYLYGVGTSPQFTMPEAQGKVDYSTNLLHEGDVVDINFQYSTNFNTVQKINLDGSLNLSTVGAVKAAGLTVLQLQGEIAAAYRPQIKDDVVTVKLITSADTVYVAGAVLRAGPIEMSRPLTVLEAIAATGGFDSTRAKLSGVKVLRIEHGRQKVYTVNLNRVLSGREPSPFFLKPFDIIYVPAKVINY